jgi:hypothetical protein
MNQKLIDIAIRRGRLIERIANQRVILARDVQPICSALQTTDHVITRVRAATGFLKKHPALVLAAVALFAALKPRGTWRWARRSFLAWRTWRTLRDQFAAIKLRSIS